MPRAEGGNKCPKEVTMASVIEEYNRFRAEQEVRPYKDLAVATLLATAFVAKVVEKLARSIARSIKV